MIIIGITGTIGAGKGTIVDYLVEAKGFCHFSVREFLISEIKNRNLPVNRDSMVIVANDLRTNHSNSYIIEKLYQKAKMSGKNSIIESIRNTGEAQFLKTHSHFNLLAVDADIHIRYQRILKRHSETDSITFEQFIENEKREMSSTEPSSQNLSECIKLADYVLNNDGSIDELIKQLDIILNKLNI